MKLGMYRGAPFRGRSNLGLSIAIAVFLTFGSSLALANQQLAQSPALPAPSASPLSNLLGAALTSSDLTTVKGSVEWILSRREMDFLAEVGLPAQQAQQPGGAATEETGGDKQSNLGDAGEFDPTFATALAMFEPADAPDAAHDAAHTATRIQLALLDSFPDRALLSNRLMQYQGTAAFDTSLRYLCSDKIYSDFYPGGTGWNNQAYDGCGPGGAITTNHDSTLPIGAPTRLDLPTLGTPTGNLGSITLPCGGSIQNTSSMTIVSQGTMPSSLGGTGSGSMAMAELHTAHGGHN
jgi:hypothetical protein